MGLSGFTEVKMSNLGQSSVGVVKGSFSRDSSESESTMCLFSGVFGFWFLVLGSHIEW